MTRQYTKVEELSEAVFARKAAGATNREILEQLIDEYIYFYSFERITLNCGLTPNEIRSKAA